MICGDLVGYLVGSRVHTGWCTVDAYHGIIPKCGGASQIFPRSFSLHSASSPPVVKQFLWIPIFSQEGECMTN